MTLLKLVLLVAAGALTVLVLLGLLIAGGLVLAGMCLDEIEDHGGRDW